MWIKNNEIRNEDIEIIGDSILVIDRTFEITKRRRSAKGFFVPILNRTKMLLKTEIAELGNRITGKWVPREQNRIADYLSWEYLKHENGYYACEILE